ncbi:MAG: hypothetical protein GY929_26675 [Actinomycetia bacterium]|nr:hypothetical protein [Actinomycetes bacterium]
MSDTQPEPIDTGLEWRRYEARPVDESEPFWEATRDQRLLLQWCHDCDAAIHYPRAACPYCLGIELGWRQAQGVAEVYSHSTLPNAASRGLAPFAPYVVALVDLPEGVRFMTNIVGCDPAEVRCGQAVKLTWEPLTDGRHLPLFTPVD